MMEETRRPIWTMDDNDIAGIEEFLNLIRNDWSQFDFDASPEEKERLQVRLAFWFDNIAGLAEHARDCLKNGGPEPGESKVSDGDDEFEPVLDPLLGEEG